MKARHRHSTARAEAAWDSMKSLVRPLLNRIPYVGAWRKAANAVGSYPAGHFHSPIPTEWDVRTRLEAHGVDQLAGISLRTQEQLALLDRFRTFYHDLPFPEQPTPECRYYFNQGFFCYADAVFF